MLELSVWRESDVAPKVITLLLAVPMPGMAAGPVTLFSAPVLLSNTGVETGPITARPPGVLVFPSMKLSMLSLARSMDATEIVPLFEVALFEVPLLEAP